MFRPKTPENAEKCPFGASWSDIWNEIVPFPAEKVGRGTGQAHSRYRWYGK